MTNFFSAPNGTTRGINLRKGQTEIINCTTYGVPKPMATTWWKDAKLLYDSAFPKSERGSLIIQNATTEDAGTYDCKTVQMYEFGKIEQITQFNVEVNSK